MADLAKIVEDLSALTVLEAAELSKMLEEKWGVSAAAPVAVAAAGGGAAAAPAKKKRPNSTLSWLTLAPIRSTSSRKSAPSPASASRKPRTSSKALRSRSRKPFRRLKLPTSRRSLRMPAPRSTSSNIECLGRGVTLSHRLRRERITQKPRENGFWVMGSSRGWSRTEPCRRSGLRNSGCETRLNCPMFDGIDWPSTPVRCRPGCIY